MNYQYLMVFFGVLICGLEVAFLALFRPPLARWYLAVSLRLRSISLMLAGVFIAFVYATAGSTLGNAEEWTSRRVFIASVVGLMALSGLVFFLGYVKHRNWGPGRTRK